ncbi:SCO family protein [Telmatospirillum sp. J64-1]|uniref:SCO family protein n=1 Tax=Telmatospirillum sp. J64-1 TaxID=2502183 RepID=UPI00115CC902|nr:SCO family protein [Telmatospirillum sp. J64-1]
MKLGRIIAVVAALLVVGLVALAGRATLWNDGGQHQAAAVPIGGPFTLVDHTGKTVTEQDFRGRPMLIYFGYAYCPDACPTSLAIMAQALDMLGPQGEEITPVFITVDPERDTVETVAGYVQAFHPRMVGLTGTNEQVEAAKKAWRVYSAKANVESATDYLVDHSSIIYLMGPDGSFVTHFSHGTTPEAVAEGLRRYLSGKMIS